MTPVTWIETFLQDLRYGTRELAKNRGVAGTAILSLVLGITATTAMFSVVHGVIIDPFPYRDIDSLTSILVRNAEQTGGRGSYSVDEYAELARRATVFDGIAGSTISDVLWTSAGEPLRLRGNHISNNGFDVMGVPALLGRTVTGLEEAPETKAVLGYRFWMRQFGGNPGLLGTTLILNGRPRTIVGVMPPRFMFRGADVYLPLRYRAGEAQEGVDWIWVTARLKAGVSPARARADVDPIIRDLAARNPTRYPAKWRVDLTSFKETFPSGIRAILWIMFGAVGLLLLIACANVANLLLARASSRESEIAMRAALGAGRGRLFRQLLTESLVLGVSGCVLGVMLSWLGLKAILAIIPPDVIPDESEIVLNLPVLGFSIVISLATTLIAGLAPALHAVSGELAVTLKEAGRAPGGSRRMGWMRAALVVVELSLAIVLLSGAGLFLHTFITLKEAPLGVEIENRLVARIPLRPERYPTAERRTAFIRDLLDQVRALPGVSAAAINAGIHPLGSWTMPAEIQGSQEGNGRSVNLHQVDADYLKATGIRLAGGRWLEDTGVAAGRHVAVVNRTFVKQWSPSGTPLGRIVRLPRLRTPPFSLADDSFEIIGITEDALHELHNGEARPEVYIPYSIAGIADMLVVHTVGDPMRLVSAIRRGLYQLDKSQVIDEPRSLESWMERDVYSGGRFRLWLMGVFGVLGLALAVIGVYGLISQVVALQSREFGIRLAVGAGFGHILGLVLMRGVRLIATGLVAGAVATILLLRRFGLELGVTDPYHAASISGAGMILIAAALVACLVPALRAARTNPVKALRLE
ncbi:MAG TPA: ABC transporter permease [Bryobacteraceae bacterium]|nr:ABC transporter permease [Bryobacteraceae bacterium]